jgi:hypothetical protein
MSVFHPGSIVLIAAALLAGAATPRRIPNQPGSARLLTTRPRATSYSPTVSKNDHEAGRTLMKKLGALILLPLALAGTSAVAGLGAGRPGCNCPDLEVHEWGTFTSIAGPDGRAVEWTPFGGPSDLPRFVTILNPTSIKTGPKGYLPTVRATVRMETPVIYFYSGRDQTVNVRVGFPHGLITEWYPQGTVPAVPALTPLAKMTGGIAWENVRISALPRGRFPVEAGKSHYYAARETDASPVQVGSQHEKFLFYRGLASFPVPVSARVAADGTIVVENTGADRIGLLILFEKRDGRLGYRVVRDGPARFTLVRPTLTQDFESLRNDLQAALTQEGLYPREAAAMIETWRDSWFEEGTRLFYMVPRASVDAILPLDIQPRPAAVVRTFVARLEIITPELQTDVEDALRRNDLVTLKKHGRFLEPIAQSLQARFATVSDQAVMKAALEAVMASSAAAAPASSALRADSH